MTENQTASPASPQGEGKGKGGEERRNGSDSGTEDSLTAQTPAPSGFSGHAGARAKLRAWRLRDARFLTAILHSHAPLFPVALSPHLSTFFSQSLSCLTMSRATFHVGLSDACVCKEGSGIGAGRTWGSVATEMRHHDAPVRRCVITMLPLWSPGNDRPGAPV